MALPPAGPNPGTGPGPVPPYVPPGFTPAPEADSPFARGGRIVVVPPSGLPGGPAGTIISQPPGLPGGITSDPSSTPFFGGAIQNGGLLPAFGGLGPVGAGVLFGPITIVAADARTVFRYQGPAVPLRVSIDLSGAGALSGFTDLNLCVTSIEATQTCLAEFKQTLGRALFVNVFGERLADFQASGLALGPGCLSNGPHGFVGVFGLYKALSLSNRPLPVAVTVGNLFINCFLVGHRVSVADPISYLGTFSLAFKFFPG